MQLFKDLFYLGIIKDFFQFFGRLLKPVIDTFTPPRSFSWQTLFWLSVFSAVVSFLIQTPLISSLVGQMGWIFLTLSVIWATQGVTWSFLGWTVRPGSGIGGAFVSWLLYFWDHTSFAFALIAWPMISAFISTIPRFLDLDRSQVFRLPGVEHRQQLATLYLTCAVLSCWIGFHFLVQSWLSSYPSLVLDDPHYSAFVVKVGESFAKGLPPDSVGVALLSNAEERLVQQLRGRPWTDTERWLIAENQREFRIFREQVMAEVQAQAQPSQNDSPSQMLFWKRSPSDVPLQEFPFWTFPALEVVDVSSENEYLMSFTTSWKGPSSRLSGFYLNRRCAIAEVQPPSRLPSPREFLPERLPRPQDFITGNVSPETLFPERSPDADLFPPDQPRVPRTSVTCDPISDVQYFRNSPG